MQSLTQRVKLKSLCETEGMVPFLLHAHLPRESTPIFKLLVSCPLLLWISGDSTRQAVSVTRAHTVAAVPVLSSFPSEQRSALPVVAGLEHPWGVLMSGLLWMSLVHS